MNNKLLAGLLLLPAILLADISVDLRFGAPPAPRHEVIGRAPHHGYVWTDGYYQWDGGHYLWVPGSWMRPPHRHAVWVRAHWDRRPRGWVMVPGHWR